MAQVPSGPRVTAVLGPTNTGKTYLAIERMLGHASGMIGFPLRLLARENYDRVVRLKGEHQAALITGEEKIVPPTARYFCCTVESMPLDRPVEFLAVDEIQLAADRERGHIFTDRLLHARGIARDHAPRRRDDPAAAAPPGAGGRDRHRGRASRTLTYTGAKKITRLPRRTAVVAFSADEVYAMAELLRRQRGGTAVVMGALSPRTRNAQVALYQSGEVDYLVATDAIGMGLNMDVDHVAFAGAGEVRRRGAAPPRRRRDGADRRPRRAPHERRHVRRHRRRASRSSPSWSTRSRSTGSSRCARCAGATPISIFPRRAALLASLDAPPPMSGLIPARDADDQLALAQMVGDPDCAARADSPRGGAAAVGRVPDPRFPQDHDRRACPAA